MEPKSKHISKEVNLNKKNGTENLTVNDAMILIAVCAAKERFEIDEKQEDDAKHIAAMAEKQPVFFDLEESIEPAINKFMNMIKNSKDIINYAQSAAKTLNEAEKSLKQQELRKTAFSWTAEIIMTDGVLSKVRKSILDKYALLLNIDNSVAQQILVEINRLKEAP